MNTDIIAMRQQPLTMSSREIAELCEKAHKNVIRDIRAMLIGLYGEEHVARTVPSQYRNRHSEFVRENADTILGAIMGDGSNWSHPQRGFKWVRDKRGYISMFELDREHTITLVAGYNVRLRKRIVDRWMELEERARALPDFTNPVAAARAWADEVELSEKRAARIADMSEDVEALERLTRADGSLNITEAAKNLGIRPKDLFDWLSQNGWIYKRPNGAAWLGYQTKCNQGLLEHKTMTVLRADGSEKISEQVRVTPKGLSKLAKTVETTAQLLD